MKTKKLLSIILTICVVNLSFISALSVSAQTTESAYNQSIQMATEKLKINVKKLIIKKRLVIKNKKDFSKFMTTPKYWKSNYEIKLKNNIDMQGKTFNSIETFNGQFDGCGHTIENVSFKCFVINNHGKISNIKFKDGKLVDGGKCGFVANNEIDGMIDSCSVNNMNSEDENIKAGFACINRGLIKNSETTLSFKTDEDKIGGFVSENYGHIEQCMLTGNVTIDRNNDCWKDKVGGFVGENNGIITNCNVEESVNGGKGTVGGFAGENNGIITNCKVKEEVTGYGNVGGFVGNNNRTITDCIAAGNVNGSDSHVGGFVGENNGTITNCNAEGNVNLTTNFSSIGGFVGNNNGTITDCTVAGNVNGRMVTGGFVGYNSGILTNCHAKVNVSGIAEGFLVGIFMGSSKWVGRVGHTEWEGITNCTGIGTLTETLNGDESRQRQQNINI